MVVLKGGRDYQTGLCKLTLVNRRSVKQQLNVVPTRHANNVHQTSSEAELMQYWHTASFSPVVSTWVKSIEKGLLVKGPVLMVEKVKKVPPKKRGNAIGTY